MAFASKPQSAFACIHVAVSPDDIWCWSPTESHLWRMSNPMKSQHDDSSTESKLGGSGASLLCGSPSMVQSENVTMASVSDPVRLPLRSTTCTSSTRHVQTARGSDNGHFLVIVDGNCTFHVATRTPGRVTTHQLSSCDTGPAFTAQREFPPSCTIHILCCVPERVKGCGRALQVSEVTLVDR